MRNIDLNAAPSRVTALFYGPTKSGKTEHLASWPKLCVLAAGSEEGWTTFSSVPADKFHEPGVMPTVKTVDAPEDFPALLRWVGDELKKKPDCFRTLAIDTFSIIADDFFSQLEQKALEDRAGKKQDGRLLYGELNTWMKARIIEAHKLPVHVIWTCHVEQPSEFNSGGGPLIPGKQAKEGFPGRCSLVLYHTVERVGTGVEFVAYSQHHKMFAAGSRFSGIPARMVDPTYRQIADAIGIVEGPITMTKHTPLVASTTQIRSVQPPQAGRGITIAPRKTK